MMAAGIVRQSGGALWRSVVSQRQAFSSAAKEIDLDSGVSLQEARTWDEGVKSEFISTPLKDIFKVRDHFVIASRWVLFWTFLPQ